MHPSLRKAAAWTALLAIGWLQLSIAVHQFDHVAEYVEDSCDVCIQLDRVDAVVGPAADGPQLPEFGLSDFDTTALSIGRDTIRGFDSRAPPLT
jgi:hypothetical protein